MRGYAHGGVGVMTVQFEWRGATETESGLAIYSIGTSTYELWLPNFKKAHQIEQAFRDVYADGRRKGLAEMMRATSDAMNEAARKL
jgi:hypothetical protein